MPDFSTGPLARALLLLAGVLVLLAISIWLARKFRGSADEDMPLSHDMLTKFRDLHAQGKLSDEEFRTIKTRLARQLREELTENDEGG